MKHGKMEPLKGEFYLYVEEVYQVETVSRGTDEVILHKISDGSRFITRYDTFMSGFKRVWKTGEVATFLNRSPRSLYRYELNGLIEKPKRFKAAGNRELRFYTKEEVLGIHELISEIHQGRPRKDSKAVNNTLPTRSEIRRVFRERFGL